MMHPLDYENSQYPKNIENLDLSKDTQLSGIKLFEKTTEDGSILLDGIQLFFSDTSHSPLFKAADTNEETVQEKYLDLDTTRTISGIQMKMFGDNLTGIRMIDAQDNYLVDYTWEADEEKTGTWTRMQTISTGKSLVGLVVNDPEDEGIYSIAFLLLDRYPYLVNDLDQNL